MNVLFWNVNKQPVNDYLLELIEEYDLDLIGLAEYKDDHSDLIRKTFDGGLDFYSIPQIGCERIKVFSKFKPGNVETLNETSYYTSFSVPHKNLGKIIYTMVHLPSKIHANEEDLFVEATILKRDIEKSEEKIECNDSIVVGDFNMNPFEKGMLAATALHAFPTKAEASHETRKVRHSTYSMFYNPMWKFIGEENAGTYYYNSSHQYSLYWNYFDQVIVRPSLSSEICNLKVITKINDRDIIGENSRPNLSDHLPIIFTIKEED